jgi:hypothetical protein
MEDDDNNNNIITITGMDGTIDTITMNDYSYTLSSEPSVSINLGDYTASTIDISSITSTDIDFTNEYHTSFNRVVFEDCMPDVGRIKDMCEHYPALAKAFENFKTIYKMVDQDYKGNHEDDQSLF